MNILELGKTYNFMGYDWTVCELVNDGRTAVLQSHGVTHGAWPGFVMPQFGNGDYYSQSIDGQDISAYDHKLKELYNAIKDVEEKSAPYGKGLYLISKEKAGFTEWGSPGSGNYWHALKAAATFVKPLGAFNSKAWLGTLNGNYYTWYVYSNGKIYSGSNQGFNDHVIAPSFNLDLSKVKVVENQIVKIRLER